MAQTAPKSFTVASARGGGRDATEQRILEATHELLQGGASLAGLSVGRIVAAAGVSRATFYLHFPDKRELIARLAEQRLTEFGEITEAFLSGETEGRDALRQTVGDLVGNWHRQAGVLAGIIELAEYDDGAREAWAATIGAIAERVAAGLANFRPDLAPARRAALAEVIAWMSERACAQMVGTGGTKKDIDRTTLALTDAIWAIIDRRD